MIKYELQGLERFIAESRTKPFDANSLAWLTNEEERIKQCWLQAFFSAAKDDTVTRYVRYHQAGLLKLSKLPDSDHPVAGVIEELIRHLRESYYSFFDPDQQLTPYGSAARAQSVRQFIGQSADRLPPDIILSLQQSAAAADRGGLSYRQAEEIQQIIALVNSRDDPGVINEVKAIFYRKWARPADPRRFQLTLSVPQFALLIRLLQAKGCFTENNVSEIIRFFTGHFASRKQSGISNKSFSRAYYSPGQTTAARVRDLLQKMIAYIDKNWFP